jgi:hypothetical protein
MTTDKELKAPAEIVDAAYRKVWSTIPHDQRLTAFANEIWQAATQAERERAAKVCEVHPFVDHGGEWFAAEIRKGGTV